MVDLLAVVVGRHVILSAGAPAGKPLFDGYCLQDDVDGEIIQTGFTTQEAAQAALDVLEGA